MRIGRAPSTRTSDARPYNYRYFYIFAAVGAAIGRPPVRIRSDRKQNVGAKRITSNLTGRATTITTRTILMRIAPPARSRSGIGNKD